MELFWNYCIEITKRIINAFMWTISKAGEILIILITLIGNWLNEIFH